MKTFYQIVRVFKWTDFIIKCWLKCSLGREEVASGRCVGRQTAASISRTRFRRNDGGNIADVIVLPKCWLVLPRAQHLWRTKFVFLKNFKLLKNFLFPRSMQCVLVLPEFHGDRRDSAGEREIGVLPTLPWVSSGVSQRVRFGWELAPREGWPYTWLILMMHGHLR